MGYSVRVTAAFEQDLGAAVSYYREQSGPLSARRFLDSYDEFCDLVSQAPRHGAQIGDSGLRWRQLGVFVIIYSVDEDRAFSQKGRSDGHLDAGSRDQEVSGHGSVLLLRLYYLSANWRHLILGDTAM